MVLCSLASLCTPALLGSVKYGDAVPVEGVEDTLGILPLDLQLVQAVAKVLGMLRRQTEAVLTK